MWYKWESIEAFNLWHEQIKLELGLPKLSVDADGNTIEGSIVNKEYTTPVTVSVNDIRAVVGVNYATNLTPTDSPYLSNYEPLAK
jgi:hypothetical protein